MCVVTVVRMKYYTKTYCNSCGFFFLSASEHQVFILQVLSQVFLEFNTVKRK